jgi:Flp pilus assembly protein TadG
MNRATRTDQSTIRKCTAWARVPGARRIKRLLSHDGGVAAVEFSLILPILVVLWIGGVEATGAFSVDRRLNNLAASIGDLIARSKKVTHAEVDDIFDLAPGALFPYSANGVSMRVTAVAIDEAGKATVAWSRAEGSKPAHGDTDDMNAFVPQALRIPKTQIIMSEVYHTYKPALGYVITGDLLLEDRTFFVPRLVPKVELCETAAPASPCKPAS